MMARRRFTDSQTASIQRMTRSGIRKSEMLSKGERDVILALVNHWFHHRGKDGGRISPGRKKLAKVADVSIRTVASTLAMLRDAEVITVVARPNGEGQKPTIYTLDLRMLWAFLGMDLPEVKEGVLVPLTGVQNCTPNDPPLACKNCTQSIRDVETVLARESAATEETPK